jgi:hypothetical protein
MRIGLLIILFGLTTAGATVASDSVVWSGYSQTVSLKADGQNAFTFYPIRRTVRAIVESSVDFRGELYILDETRIKRWLEEGVFEPLVTFDVFGGLSIIFQPPNRGFYAFIVHNDLNETRDVSFRFTEFGFEYDLLIVSSVFLIIGSGLLLTSVLSVAFRHRSNEAVKNQNT